MCTKFLSPVVRNVLFLPELRPNEHVNMMAKFVVKSISKRDIPYKRNPKGPTREASKYLIDI
jgi:hypothetical protein